MGRRAEFDSGRAEALGKDERAQSSTERLWAPGHCKPSRSITAVTRGPTKNAQETAMPKTHDKNQFQVSPNAYGHGHRSVPKRP